MAAETMSNQFSYFVDAISRVWPERITSADYPSLMHVLRAHGVEFIQTGTSMGRDVVTPNRNAGNVNKGTPPNLKNMKSTKEAAAFLGITEDQLRRLRDDGSLTAQKIEGRGFGQLYFPVKQLERYKKTHAKGATV